MMKSEVVTAAIAASQIAGVSKGVRSQSCLSVRAIAAAAQLNNDTVVHFAGTSVETQSLSHLKPILIAPNAVTTPLADAPVLHS